MKKLALSLDALQVQSFRMVPAPGFPGVVFVEEEEATTVCVLTDATCDPVICRGTV
jgi:hypothetical protein